MRIVAITAQKCTEFSHLTSSFWGRLSGFVRVHPSPAVERSETRFQAPEFILAPLKASGSGSSPFLLISSSSPYIYIWGFSPARELPAPVPLCDSTENCYIYRKYRMQIYILHKNISSKRYFQRLKIYVLLFIYANLN